VVVAPLAIDNVLDDIVGKNAKVFNGVALDRLADL